MNPAILLLGILGLIGLWFLLAFAFRPLGKFIFGIGKEAMDEINKDDDEKETN